MLQESGVAYAFVEESLPVLDKGGMDMHIYYVASAELFDLLPGEPSRRTLPRGTRARPWASPASRCRRCTGGFRSGAGRAASCTRIVRGHYLGSGQGEKVLEEAGLDGASQARAIVRYAEARRRAS